MEKYRLLNGNNLAFIGDAYFELRIRVYLINKGITKSNELKKESLKYVSATSHAKIYHQIKDLLTEEENDAFRKGRNNFSKSHRKNMNIGDYSLSSGLEAVIGYLYLKNDLERLDFLINKMIEKREELE